MFPASISSLGDYLRPGGAAPDTGCGGGLGTPQAPPPRAQPGPAEVRAQWPLITSLAGGSGLCIQCPARGAEITRVRPAPPNPRSELAWAWVSWGVGCRQELWEEPSCYPHIATPVSPAAWPSLADLRRGRPIPHLGPTPVALAFARGPLGLQWSLRLLPCTVHPETRLTPSQPSSPDAAPRAVPGR